MPTRWVLFVVLALTALACTGVLLIWGKEIAPLLHPEVFKLVAELIIVVGIAGLASLVLTEISMYRERRESRRVLHRATLAELVNSYNEVKCVRRLLRAEAVRPSVIDPGAHVLKEPYASLLSRLNGAQLKLEAQLRLIEENKPQYPEPDELCKQLGAAEEYLGAIITEWEGSLGCFKAAAEDNKLADFVALRCFVADAGQSFKPCFSTSMTKSFAILGKSLDG